MAAASPHGAVAAPTLGDALHAFAEAQLAAALHGLAARGPRLHAGVHQARKSIRRSRAVLRLVGTDLGAGTAWVERELRRANRRLAMLRDAHALVETLDRLLHRSSAQAHALKLRRARRIAATRRAALARDPERLRERDDVHAAVAMLRAALAGLAWHRVTQATLVLGLADSEARAERERARAVASGDDEDWHRWRRWMRRLSQQHRACRAAGIELDDSRFDKSLAGQLGVLQDLSLLLEHCTRGSPFAKPDRRVLKAFARARLSRQRERIASVLAGG